MSLQNDNATGDPAKPGQDRLERFETFSFAEGIEKIRHVHKRNRTFLNWLDTVTTTVDNSWSFLLMYITLDSETEDSRIE